MSYLGLALYAEGPTDYYFFRPLLRRLCEELCARRGAGPVDIGDILALDDPEERRKGRREERIAEAARAAKGAWHILFVHADGAGNANRAREELVVPALRRLEAELSENFGAVAVIPIRETEAWLLADGDALRRAFGTSRSNDDLGLTRHPHEVERIEDPKQVLASVYDQVTNLRKGRKKNVVSAYFELIGEMVSVAELSKVPSFKQVETQLIEVLQKFRFIQ